MPRELRRRNKEVKPKDKSAADDREKTTLVSDNDDGDVSDIDVDEERSTSESDNDNEILIEENEDETIATLWWFSRAASFIVGITIAVIIWYFYAQYIALLHENRLWFSNIKEVEREISFRTESGLYYSYYKQMLKAPSINQGLYELTHDNMTENWRTINVLERMNIYQEVILSIMYRMFNIAKWLEPVYFYIDTVLFLHGMYVIALYCTSWMLSGSWLSGVLTAAFYIFNKEDTTRVEFTIPLRESFSLPFLFMQIAFITYYFRPQLSQLKQRIVCCFIGLCTLFFVLTWQFAQFVLLLQAMALFGCAVLDMVPLQKIKTIYIIHIISLMTVCTSQFFHPMILGSLVLSFIPAAFMVFHIKGKNSLPCGIMGRIFRIIFYIISVLGLMVAVNNIIKNIINIEADEHIFKFLSAKFGFANTRDFDANLYLCTGAFGFLPFDTFERLSSNGLFPLYLVVQTALLVILAIALVQNWKNESSLIDNCHAKDTLQVESKSTSHILSERPELVFHAIQTVFFGLMALSTMRFKYLWTPEMCILAGFAIGDSKTWKFLVKKFNITSELTIEIVRHTAIIIVLVILVVLCLPALYAELDELREFYDPDTVDLMEWIKNSTSKSAVFSGSMQLLAGVKLCTGRKLTNHPHYEDKQLREKTIQVYQYYGRQDPDIVYNILKDIGVHYIILEDSICYSRGPPGCTLPELVDMANSHVINGEIEEDGQVKPKYGRFCDQIKKLDPAYIKKFKIEFQNKTFRVYRLL